VPVDSHDHDALDVLDTSFRLLVCGPSPLAIDGAALGHGLPARLIPLDELRALLLDRDTSYAARDAAVGELLCRARHQGGAWTVGLAGVLAPGLRRVAAALAGEYPGDRADIDAEVLAGLLDGIGRPARRDHPPPAGQSGQGSARSMCLPPAARPAAPRRARPARDRPGGRGAAARAACQGRCWSRSHTATPAASRGSRRTGRSRPRRAAASPARRLPPRTPTPASGSSIRSARRGAAPATRAPAQAYALGRRVRHPAPPPQGQPSASLRNPCPARNPCPR